MTGDNICALSTAPGAAGVAIIRLSGESVFDVAEKMFRPRGSTSVKAFEPYRLYTGEIVADDFVDFGMAVRFVAPKSYTGENMVEFHCHGGVAIVGGIIKKAIDCGCRPANKGEFTRRAFLNGKMSLSAAEGLIDMINSESEGEVRAGWYLYREDLKKQVDAVQDKLTSALARIDASIDYPDEVDEEAVTAETAAVLGEAREFVRERAASYGTGRKVKNGVVVGIVGRPNVGKSSLLNALEGYDKAIVSDIPGTTRDVVEGEADIEGVRFSFRDTAGIRDTGDAVENIGVDRAKKVIGFADIVIVLVDGAVGINDDDRAILGLAEETSAERLVVVNKCDLGGADIVADLHVSAKTGKNIAELKRLLYNKTVGCGIDLYKDCLTEQRHYEACLRADALLGEALAALGGPLDMVAADILNAWNVLGEISGRTASEEIIDRIFAKFCVGK